MKKISLTLVLLLTTTILQAQETSKLTTYYPAPYGAYDRVRFVPKSPALSGTCQEGTIYYNNVANRFEFCPNSGTWGQVFNVWTQAGNDVYLTDSANANIRVGIGTGTATPEFKLHLAGDAGILATGTKDSGAQIVILNAGTHLVWYPFKAAFRAGTLATPARWDHANIGDYSAAFGYDNLAKGEASFVSGYNNQVTGNYSFVGGGKNHSITGESSVILGGGDGATGDRTGAGIGSTIAGNYAAIIGGRDNVNNGAYSSILGGDNNLIQNTADHSAIGNGDSNIISGNHSFIGSGYSNTLYGNKDFIGSGKLNQIVNGAEFSVIGGGFENKINGPSGWGNYSTIGGGSYNLAPANYATVAGGGGDTAAKGNVATTDYATVGGGQQNKATGEGSTVAGGLRNTASGVFATVGGGGGDGRILINTMQALGNTASGDGSTVSGGSSNTASNTWATVGGGQGNIANGFYTTVTGGWGNVASGNWATVAGGTGNRALSGGSAILGGAANLVAATAGSSVILGGVGNTVTGSDSWLLGSNTTVAANNSFVFNPTTVVGANITQNNSFLIFPEMGAGAPASFVGIGLKNPSATLHVNGDIKASLKNLLGVGAPMYYEGAGGHLGYDIAEYFETSEEVEIGDLLVIDAMNPTKLKKSSTAYDKKVAGIVSAAPAILFEGSELTIAPEAGKFQKGTKPPVALAGRVLCKVSTENGPIETGDLLTASSVPGHAMKAGDPQQSFGAVIGKALEPFSGGPNGEKTGAIVIILSR